MEFTKNEQGEGSAACGLLVTVESDARNSPVARRPEIVNWLLIRDKSVPSGNTLKMQITNRRSELHRLASITILTEQNIASKTGFE